MIKLTYSGSAEVYHVLRGIQHPALPGVYEAVHDGSAVTVPEEYISGAPC